MSRIIYPGEDDARIGVWVGERVGVMDWGKFKAFGVERDGGLVAGIIFNRYSWPDIAMHVAGEGGHWLSRSLLKELFHYAFNVCECRRVTGVVHALAESVLEFDRKIGFVREGRARKAAPDGNDLIILGMLREECRFLEGGENEKSDRLAA